MGVDQLKGLSLPCHPAWESGARIIQHKNQLLAVDDAVARLPATNR